MLSLKNVTCLTSTEESALVKEMAVGNSAYKRLVESLLPTVWELASAYGDRAEDYFEECLITLMEKIAEYDPAFGVPLNVYIRAMIKAKLEILKALETRKKERPVYVNYPCCREKIPAPAEIRELPKLERAVLERVYSDNAGVNEIAVTLHISPQEVHELHDCVLGKLGVRWQV